MKPQLFNPSFHRTRPSRRRQLLRFTRWLGLFIVLMAMALCVVTAIARLHNIEARLDAAFMQGMKAGFDICPVGTL